MKPYHHPRLAHALGRLLSLGLLAALLAGCAFGRPAPAPTMEPPRLLDPTPLSAPTAVATLPPGQAGTTQPAAGPGEASLVIVGLVEAIDGEIWAIDGLRLRVPAAALRATELGLGRLVRAVVRVTDDDREIMYIALSVEPAREVVLVGQLTAIDPVSLILDGRALVLPAGFAAPAGLLPGVIVRVVADDDGGALVVRSVTLLPEAQVLGGTIELISGEIIVVGGQRLRLAPDALLWRVRLVVGEPVRIIVLIREGVLTIVSITIVQIVVPPAVVVVPPPVVVEPVPAPRPPAPRPPSSGGDDDDDDDDDD